MEESLFHGSLVSSRRIVYTPSPFAKAYLLHLQETGSLKATRPHTSRRAGLSSYLFFIVRSGAGELSYEGKAYPLEAGDCIFLSCESAYSHTTSKDLWELVWAHFASPAMAGIYKKYRERGGAPVFHPGNIAPFLSCLSDLYAAASSDDYIRDMRINEILARLLSLLMEQSWHPENGKERGEKNRVPAQVKAYLDAHYAEKITLDDLAGEFFVNKFTLTRVFKERYGTTIMGYLTSLRISEAKRLLRFTDLAIEEIGPRVGIPDANYLSRLFSRVEGVSPAVYKKSWQGGGR
ncbi:MAG: AraC family transcriptional regulator [Lachnospiraceae bacterium]|jgi:AraC-like DNA-binding protein|nr:AraC family transcriptional regulator [Lachnospiraceae bacterium]